MTSSQLLDKLENDQGYRTSVAGADLVTVFIGFNDFAIGSALYDQGRCGGNSNQDCLATIVSNFNGNLTGIVTQVRSIDQQPGAVILLSDLYNPWVSQYAANGTTDIFIPFMDQMNDVAHSVGTTEALGVTGVYQAFNGSDGSGDPVTKGYILDGVHPNDTGHEVIATQFRNLDSLLSPSSTPTPSPTSTPPPSATSTPTPKRLMGDVNNDGVTNAVDAALALQFTAGLVPGIDESADVNNDGVVNAIDATLILQYSAGLISAP